MPVPLNAVRQSAVFKKRKQTGATVGSQNDVSQYAYKQGETSADEVTVWQQNAYNDHTVQAARHQLWRGRTTPKVVMNHDDTSVSNGSRIEEIGSSFRLQEPKGKAKERQDKTESVSSFTPSAFSLSPHMEVEMKRVMRDLSDSNRIAERAMVLNVGVEDTGDADSEDSDDSQSTVVFRTPRALERKKIEIKIKEERERSPSTPPVLRVSRWADGETINIESTSESHHSCHSHDPNLGRGEWGATVQEGAAPHQGDDVVAPHYGSIVQSVQPHIFLHLLAREEHQQGGSTEIAQAIRQVHDLGVTAVPGKVNDRPLQRMVQEVVDEERLRMEDDRSNSIVKTIETVLSLKNDFQGFESDRDQE